MDWTYITDEQRNASRSLAPEFAAAMKRSNYQNTYHEDYFFQHTCNFLQKHYEFIKIFLIIELFATTINSNAWL